MNYRIALQAREEVERLCAFSQYFGRSAGRSKVASPIYKQNFNLITGECFDDETVRVAVFLVRVVDGHVQVGIEA
jgi:nitrite reductase/ring-hydroxylating ferredoxin subunit